MSRELGTLCICSYVDSLNLLIYCKYYVHSKLEWIQHMVNVYIINEMPNYINMTSHTHKSTWCRVTRSWNLPHLFFTSWNACLPGQGLWFQNCSLSCGNWDWKINYFFLTNGINNVSMLRLVIFSLNNN